MVWCSVPEWLIGLEAVLTGSPVVGKGLQVDAGHLIVVVHAAGGRLGVGGPPQLAEAVAQRSTLPCNM